MKPCWFTSAGRVRRFGDDASSSGPLKVSGDQPVVADDLFAALDGRELLVDGDSWHIVVYSIRDLKGRRFVQCGAGGVASLTVTLRLSLQDGAHEALLQLKSWLANRDKAADGTDASSKTNPQ